MRSTSGVFLKRVEDQNLETRKRAKKLNKMLPHLYFLFFHPIMQIQCFIQLLFFAMKKIGRPAKLISKVNILELKLLMQNAHYLTAKQNRIFAILDLPLEQFTDRQLAELKAVLREQEKFQQRQKLLQDIQLKQKNLQRLNVTELEILDLASRPQDRDTFFRLDRALESYQKIGKAIEANKIRVEVEKNRAALLKRQEKAQHQKQRTAENRLKYTLGGLLLSILKEKGQIVDLNAIDDVKKQLRQAFELDQN